MEQTKEHTAPRYLDASTIREVQTTPTPLYGMTREGYTVRAGAPTRWLIRLAGESRWRRVMVWQFSNAGTAFVRIGGEPMILSDSACHTMDEMKGEPMGVAPSLPTPVRDLWCGCVESWAGGLVSLTHENGAYLVKRHPSHPAGHTVEGFRTLGDARRAARRLSLA